MHLTPACAAASSVGPGSSVPGAVAPSARDAPPALLEPIEPSELDGLAEWERELRRDFAAGDDGRASDDEWRETDDEEG